MNTAEPTAHARPSVTLRAVRVVALLGLAMGLSFIADLLVSSQFRSSLDLIRAVLYFGMPVVKASVVPPLVLVGISLGVIGIGGSRLWLRQASGRMYCGLLVIAVLVADLLVVAFVWPDIADPLLEVFHYHETGGLLVVGLLGVIPLVVFALTFRLRSGRWIAGGYVGLGLVLAYLAKDDAAIGPPITFEQISPEFPGADVSFNVLMRYGRNHPLGKNFHYSQRTYQGRGGFVNAKKPAEWPAWLASHREAIETDWAELAPVRAWIDELNGFDRISDLMPPDVTAEIIAFGPFRAYSNHACEIAGLQALSGHGDEAIATLLPLLQVSRKLEPSSRSLVRAMTARVMQDTGLTTARFVLDRTPVSAGMRGRLADSLRLGVGGEDGVRHLIAIERTFFSAASTDRPLGEFIPVEKRRNFLVRSLSLVGPFLYNQQHTAKLHREISDRIQEFAARRDMTGLKQAYRAFAAEHADPKFKNFMGDFIVGAAVPGYEKVVEAYWRIEDSRTAMLTRLTNPGPSLAQDAAAPPADEVARATALAP